MKTNNSKSNSNIKKALSDMTTIVIVLALVLSGVILFEGRNSTAVSTIAVNVDELVIDKSTSAIDTAVENDIVKNEKNHPLQISFCMVDYVTGEYVYELPSYVEDETSKRIYEWISEFSDDNGYTDCTIIECCYDAWEDGVSVHFVFDNERYMCVWFDMHKDGSLVLYDKDIDFWFCQNYQYV